MRRRTENKRASIRNQKVCETSRPSIKLQNRHTLSRKSISDMLQKKIIYHLLNQDMLMVVCVGKEIFDNINISKI